MRLIGSHQGYGGLGSHQSICKNSFWLGSVQISSYPFFGVSGTCPPPPPYVHFAHRGPPMCSIRLYRSFVTVVNKMLLKKRAVNFLVARRHVLSLEEMLSYNVLY